MKKEPSQKSDVRYPGIPTATDGSGAVIHSETLASEAAGAYPITPSTQMGEGWALAVAAGQKNVFGRNLIFFEPEGEHAAAGVTAGMSMMGLRSTNFSSGQGIAYMHESLYAAAGKRLTYVLNVAARAMTKHALNVHAGHDDYHAVDDTGFFQLFGKNVQEIADLTLIAHRIAELSLNPGVSAQDGFLTSHVIEDVLLPEPDLIREYLGDPSDLIDCPTPAQRLVFGAKRRRIPELFNLDYPAMLGVVQNQDAYAQGVAAQRPFYFDHLAEITDQAFREYGQLTGRHYARVMGYRMDDAEWVLAGQGTVVPNAEAVADHLREKGIKVGVLNFTMFRPFPADLMTRILAGKKGVTVLERVDQPLAVDPPLLREIRSAMGQAVENFRTHGVQKRAHPRYPEPREAHDVKAPFPALAVVAPDDVPDFYAAGFGFGSRDLQPGDLVAAVENMLPKGEKQRHYYLGVEFIREGTRLPKLQIWQDQLQEAYPDIGKRALKSTGDINLLPKDAISLRIHSVGGWGAITTGKNISATAFEMFGLHVKANPKYGSEKKGQPTTFYAVFSHEEVRPNAELKHVNVVLSPDGNVFKHSNPLAGLSSGGVFVIQSDRSPEETWNSFPEYIQRDIRERGIKVHALDGFGIASSEATDAELRYRMQGAAFMGAFFAASPILEQEGMTEERLFEGLEAQIRDKFGKKGEQVVQDNVRVIRRGFDELVTVPVLDTSGDEATEAPAARMPTLMDVPAEDGLADPGRFFEQVCAVCAVGQDGIADPFAAISAIPAATSAVRDMTDIRFEVPDFIPEKCTGCSQCWVQCPDAAIPGLVVSVENLLEEAVTYASNGKPKDRVKQISRHLAREARKQLKGVPFKTFADTLSAAYGNVSDKLGWDAERRAALDEEWASVYSVLSEFPLAKTTPFYDVPENREKGSGGLLAITISPEACKGCNICVDVCPENALITVRQDEEIVDRLRRNWKFWEQLPDTEDRYVNVRNLDEGIGVLSSLLLKKENYRSMAGGDGACMGCGEKTAVHLVVSTIEAVMHPRVDKLLNEVDSLTAGLARKAHDLVSEHTDVDAAAQGSVEVKLPDDVRAEVDLLNRSRKELEDLKWRYTTGPSGRGRAPLGITNSTGCSSVWGSTYPYNPYPFPWVNHLFQDAPSIAIGIFEGHMRKMGDAFISLRRARKLVEGGYDKAADELFFSDFDWQQFDDDEFKLCPPILSIGGDGAMLDIGFQNLSRLMASGKPIRVLVLDTQVYSNTGGQACTSGFTGQVADMSAWGKAHHGKEEVRKELGYIAIAHRGVFVHQSSQALASHLMEGVIKGLNTRRPSIFNIYTPCPVEHGLADDWAPEAAKLALEARAFPFFTYDPDGGRDISDCLSLEGNPAMDATWPTYNLTFRNEEGEEVTEEYPLTIADWAFTETRFRKHFRSAGEGDPDLVLFHEFVDLSHDEREGKRPFIWMVDGSGNRSRIVCSNEMVFLAEERLLYWHQLRELAGLDVPDSVRDTVSDALERQYQEQAAKLRAEYEAKLTELEESYPRLIARRMAEGLLAAGADRTVEDILTEAAATPGLSPIGPVEGSVSRGVNGGAASAVAAPPVEAPAGAAVAPEESDGGPEADAPTAEAELGVAPAQEEDEDEDLLMEPYIDSALCTSCNECTNINGQMFAYDENKQAYIKDPRAGTYAQLVQAAEKCPAAIIHPGDPLNPKEKDLEKWKKRAEPFN
ncbi:MAG: 2-oxoacid:acceptor oxidoreductase family protein [Gemmatimonadales bacterium]|jgi:pyruvate-ferredoxin/flavodoxin oxidoreductase|nr:MAG: 2-oxoacid:acceptor oxidoreductase family protein [Gemmatimonadales bacterium]